MAKIKVLSKSGLQELITKLEGIFVKTVAGKGLSTNDYTTAEKSKLTNIEASAQVNKLEGLQLNGADVAITNKKANINLNEYAKKTDITSVFKVKGSKANYAELPTTENTAGDVWNLSDTGANYVWTGTEWDKLSETVDLSGYVQKEAGKGLSTNDYTTAEKTKLAGLSNYSHPNADGNKHVPANGTANAGKVLTAGATAGVYTWEDIPTCVEEITNSEIDSMFS